MSKKNNLLKNVLIIGCGSLGGFLAKRLSNYNKIKKITLIDYDTIEQKNFKNSIYNKNEGSLKVDVLKKIINKDKPNLKIITDSKKFIDNESDIDQNNYIIDCRDFTYNRCSKINARFQISYNYLCSDFRKNIKFNNPYFGKYSDIIIKSNIEDAAFLASSILILLDKRKYKNLLEENVYNFNLLDLSDHMENNLNINKNILMDQFIFSNLKDQKLEQDVIFELQKIDITNIAKVSYQIFEINKKHDITFYFKNGSRIFKQKTFIDIMTVFNSINNFVKDSEYNSYFIDLDINSKIATFIQLTSAC